VEREVGVRDGKGNPTPQMEMVWCIERPPHKNCAISLVK